MSRCLALLIGLLFAGHSPSVLAAPSASESALVFNATPPKNDLKGDFEAQVLFAQSQVIPARPREDDRQPRLISLRKALLMVRPLRSDASPISVAALDGFGEKTQERILAGIRNREAYNKRHLWLTAAEAAAPLAASGLVTPRLVVEPTRTLPRVRLLAAKVAEAKS